MAKQKPLSDEDVAVILGMLRRGDRQMDVAVYHGVNQGRVNELAKMSTSWARKWRHVRPSDTLPDAGPYIVVGSSGYERLREAAAVPMQLLSTLQSDIAEIKRMMTNGYPHAATGCPGTAALHD